MTPHVLVVSAREMRNKFNGLMLRGTPLVIHFTDGETGEVLAILRSETATTPLHPPGPPVAPLAPVFQMAPPLSIATQVERDAADMLADPQAYREQAYAEARAEAEGDEPQGNASIPCLSPRIRRLSAHIGRGTGPEL